MRLFPQVRHMEHQSQARPTVAEIDGRALADNFAELARIAGGRGVVLPVVKSDAYGHGLARVARILYGAGAERFAVATAAEGEVLRAAGLNAAVVVLGGVYPAEHERVVAARLTPVVWDADGVRALAASARAAGRVVPVHVQHTDARRIAAVDRHEEEGHAGAAKRAGHERQSRRSRGGCVGAAGRRFVAHKRKRVRSGEWERHCGSHPAHLSHPAQRPDRRQGRRAG